MRSSLSQSAVRYVYIHMYLFFVNPYSLSFQLFITLASKNVNMHLLIYFILVPRDMVCAVDQNYHREYITIVRFFFVILSKTPMHRNTFVYEYVGEVVRHDAMVRRMSDYAEENIKHFYFMMLQPNEVT